MHLQRMSRASQAPIVSGDSNCHRRLRHYLPYYRRDSFASSFGGAAQQPAEIGIPGTAEGSGDSHDGGSLRVLLRLERNRIGEALRGIWLISPSASASLDDVANQIDQLTKRLGVAERINDLRLKLESSYETSPPSVVDTALQAADTMHSYTLF
jgi:hypothetical protein